MNSIRPIFLSTLPQVKRQEGEVYRERLVEMAKTVSNSLLSMSTVVPATTVSNGRV